MSRCLSVSGPRLAAVRSDPLPVVGGQVVLAIAPAPRQASRITVPADLSSREVPLRAPG